MNADPPARGARRWLRFRLRTLLIVAPLLTIAVAFGLRAWYQQYRQTWAIEQIERVGGTFDRDTEGQITGVELPGKAVDDAALQQLLPALAALPKLRSLTLASNDVTDAGLEHLATLPRLEVVFLAGTKVTPEGVAKLKAARPQLNIDLTTPHPRAMALVARPIYQHAIISLALATEGRLLGGSGDGRVQIWDLRRAAQAGQFRAHREWTFAVVRHPTKNWFATGGGDGLIKLWDASSGRELARYAGHDDDVHGLDFTPDGTRLVSTSDDLTVRIWDVATRTQLHKLEGHADTIPGVAVSPDGTLAASASRDGTIRLWDITTGAPVGVLQGHADDVMSVDFHPAGRELASASYDGTVKIWNVAERRALHTLNSSLDWKFGVRYAPDGTRLVAIGADGMRLWDNATQKMLWYDATQSDVASALWLDNQRIATSAADGSVILRNRRGEELATLWTRFYDDEARVEGAHLAEARDQ